MCVRERERERERLMRATQKERGSCAEGPSLRVAAGMTDLLGEKRAVSVRAVVVVEEEEEEEEDHHQDIPRT